MRGVRLAFWPAAFAFGIAAEWAGRPPLIALDAVTGFSLLGLGLLAASRRAWSRAGLILAAAGLAWFLGSFAGWAVYLHRGPLAQLLLTYPAAAGRRQPWPARGAVAAGYGYAAIYPLAHSDPVTLIFALALVALAVRRYRAGRGPERRARAHALAAAIAFGAVLATGSALRLAGAPSPAVLSVYETVIVLIAAGLTADLSWINERGDVTGGYLAPPHQKNFHGFLWHDGKMTDLPPVGGAAWAFGNAVNDRDQVVGNENTASNHEIIAALWSGGHGYDLNTLVAPSRLQMISADYITDEGDIFGHGVLPNGDQRVFLLIRNPGVPLPPTSTPHRPLPSIIGPPDQRISVRLALRAAHLAYTPPPAGTP